MKQIPSCRTLVASWAIFFAGVCAMQFLGQAGMVVALLIVPIWAVIRGGHDQEIAEWLFRSPGIAPKLAASYYVLVSIAFALLTMKGARLDELPLAAGLVIILFPPLVAMAVADHRVCARRRNTTASS